FQGKWWIINMPPANYGDAGRFVNGAIKLLVQKAILKRRVSDDSNIVTIWGDEALNAGCARHPRGMKMGTRLVTMVVTSSHPDSGGCPCTKYASLWPSLAA